MLHLETLELFTLLKVNGKVVEWLNLLDPMAIKYILLLKEKVFSEAVRPNLFTRSLEEQEPVLVLRALLSLETLQVLNQQKKEFLMAAP